MSFLWFHLSNMNLLFGISIFNKVFLLGHLDYVNLIFKIW